MARMKYKGDSRGASLHDAARPMTAHTDAAQADVVIAPPPIEVLWSLHTYPFPDPERVAAVEAERAEHAAAQERRRRRTRGGEDL